MQKIGSCARRGFYCIINQQSRLCELGTNQYCVYQRWDLVGGTEQRSDVCEISQLFECHILSVNELVRDRFSSMLNCSWDGDPGGGGGIAGKIWEIYACTQHRNNAMHI